MSKRTKLSRRLKRNRRRRRGGDNRARRQWRSVFDPTQPWLGLEPLETRVLLNADPTNVFANFSGVISEPGEEDVVSIHLTAENFTIGAPMDEDDEDDDPSARATLGFIVRPVDDSGLTPATVTIMPVIPAGFEVQVNDLDADDDDNGLVIFRRTGLPDGSSLALAKLEHGDYDVQITGADGTEGAWELQIFLVGDVTGDFVVDQTDIGILKDAKKGTIPPADVLPEGDANRDGSITGYDMARAEANKGVFTTVRILTVTTLLDPAFDTGVVGDNLVNQTPVNVIGLTLAGAQVTLDEDGDGFDDGTTTATPLLDTTNYALAADLLPGDNTLRVEARDSFGQSAQAQTVVTLDSTPPTVTATSPAEAEVVDGAAGVNIPVELIFSETMIGSTVLAALSVSGNLSGAITPLAPAFDDATSTLSFEISESLTDTAIAVTVADSATDLAGSGLDGGPFILNFAVQRLATITEISPANGEEMVSVTREAIIRFSRAIDPATITSDSFEVIALGSEVPGRRGVSSTERFVTFFPDEPWNPSTEVRIQVNGDLIFARSGQALDADGDGEPGGTTTADFRTLPLTRISGTNVFGFIFDSFSEQPIIGATIRVDAFPEANAITDENGRFELLNMPAPVFFVHVDGSTATNAPEGFVYPNVGKPFHSVPGQTVQIEMDREVFDIFLPPMALGDIQPLSATEPTDVGFGDAGKSELALMFPDIDPAVWDQMKVTFAPGAAVDDFGNPATEASIIPVPPDRIPAPLPPTLDPELVISIQAGGATNFDVPAPIAFPNMTDLGPGEKSLIFSFDHDAGEWKVIGTGTVNEDGSAILSDPDVGVLAPGWHFTDPGTEVEGETEVTLEIGFVLQPQTINMEASLIDINLLGFFNPKIPIGNLDFTTKRAEKVLSTVKVKSDEVDKIRADTNNRRLIAVGEVTGSALGAGLGGVRGTKGQAFIFLDIPIPSATIFGLSFAFGFDPPIKIQGLPFLFSGATIGIGATSKLGVTGIVLNLSDPILDNFFVDSLIDKNHDNKVDEDFNIGLSIDLVRLTSGQIPLDIRLFVREVSGQTQSLASSAPISSDSAVQEIDADTELRIHSLSSLEPIPFSRAPGFGSDTRDFYRFVLPGGFELFGRTTAAGAFSEILPQNSAFDAFFYSPDTNRTAILSGVSGPSGSTLELSPLLDLFGGTDSDGDGLPDVGEFVIGTSPTNADTDGDGITDDAEIAQGLDPLDNRGFPTGIISSLSLTGEAKEVVIEGSTLNAQRQTAYVATGSHGLAIVDASQFNNPIILGQLNLPGDATDVAVDSGLQIAAVASIGGGLHLVDVSDPMLPALIQTITINASQIEVVDGVAYVAVGSELRAYDLLTGERLESLMLGGFTLTGLAREGSLLYTMNSARRLRAIDISGSQMVARGSLALPNGGGKLFVGNGIAYVPVIRTSGIGGFATVDVSDPDNLFLISDSDFTNATGGPGTAIAVNGSGLATLVGFTIIFADDFDEFLLMNVSDPENTNDPGPFFRMTGDAQGVTIAAGIAFVADGSAGLQVVNYLPFDNQGQPPTVIISTPVADVDPATAGIQVVEGASIPIRADVFDDVQVHNVELLVNGEIVRNDVSFPFDFSAIALSDDPEALETTVQVRATDTGGNNALSNMLVFDLVPDTTPPTIVNIDPPDGATRIEGLGTVRIGFSEPIDPDVVTTTNFMIVEAGPDAAFGTADDVPVEIVNLQLRSDDTLVQLTTDPLDVGFYQIRIQETVTDRTGNALGSGDVVSSFELVPDVIPPQIVSIDPPDGATRLAGLRTVRIQFSEPIDPDGVTTTNFMIVEAGPDAAFGTADDVPVEIVNLQLRGEDTLVQLTTDPLGVGIYLIRIQDTVTDRAGNALGSGDVVSSFTLADILLYGGTAAGFGVPKGALVSLDQTAGTATLISDPTNPAVYGGLPGLAFDDASGRFFGVATPAGVTGEAGGGRFLIELDPVTGEFMGEIAAIAGARIKDIDFQPGTNKLFGLGRNAQGPGIFEIDTTTGVATRVANFSASFSNFAGALAFAPDGTLYVLKFEGAGCCVANSRGFLQTRDPNNLSVVTSTVALTPNVASLPGILYYVDAMAVRPIDGTIFAGAIWTDRVSDFRAPLVTIDPSTGAITEVGEMDANVAALDFISSGVADIPSAAGAAEAANSVVADGDGLAHQHHIIPLSQAASSSRPVAAKRSTSVDLAMAAWQIGKATFRNVSLDRDTDPSPWLVDDQEEGETLSIADLRLPIVD